MDQQSTPDFRDEDNLDVAAEVFRALCVVAGIVIFLTMGLKPGPSTLNIQDSYSDIHWPGFFIAVSVSVVGVVGYYIIKVVGNISRSLKSLSLGKIKPSHITS